MKKIFSIVTFISFLFCASFASAEIKQSDLNKSVELTQGALLLQQVDTVSLYLSSERVAFAPKLAKDAIEVETTVLDSTLIGSPAAMKDYMDRLCNTFVSVLKERLPNYAPAIAKNFDETKDVRFVLNAGQDRRPLGTWVASAGMQTGADAAAATLPTDELNQAGAPVVSDNSEKKGCGCPVRK